MFIKLLKVIIPLCAVTGLFSVYAKKKHKEKYITPYEDLFN